MDWIKKNPAQFAVMLIAVLTITADAWLFSIIFSFNSNVTGAPSSPKAAAKTESPVQAAKDALAKAAEAIDKPVVWQPAKDAGRLFVSRKYVVRDGKLEEIKGKMFHTPVPNDWLTDHGLDPLLGTVLDDDPDKDGFTTRQEWDGVDTVSHLDNNGQPVIGPNGQPLLDDSTNPNNPNSHPPYHTRLQLTQVIAYRFRLLFMGHDFDPGNPDATAFQINTIDRNNRTYFVKIGEKIPDSKFKVTAFKHKEIPAKEGTKTDVSELIVTNEETNQPIPLPYRQVVDSPDRQAVFKYSWTGPDGKETPIPPIRRGGSFGLPPEKDKLYKVIDIQANEAVVELPTGEKKTFQQTK